MGIDWLGRIIPTPALDSDRGQMAVEFAVTLPVLLVVALVAVNVGLFLSECAMFDRVARNAVRICATSPSYGEDVGAFAVRVEEMIEAAMGCAADKVTVTTSDSLLGYDTYVAQLMYRPTLFGMPLRSELWGVQLPVASHEARFVVDRYRPGIVV